MTAICTYLYNHPLGRKMGLLGLLPAAAMTASISSRDSRFYLVVIHYLINL